MLLMQTNLDTTDAFWVYTVQISTFELFAILTHTHPHLHLCCKGSTQLATIHSTQTLAINAFYFPPLVSYYTAWLHWY